ncbi:MAG: hypothetical protein RIQ93_2130 [Verrucomicrobiota bacterium]|jgi:hypothetical protein
MSKTGGGSEVAAGFLEPHAVSAEAGQEPFEAGACCRSLDVNFCSFPSPIDIEEQGVTLTSGMKNPLFSRPVFSLVRFRIHAARLGICRSGRQPGRRIFAGCVQICSLAD